MEEVRNSPAVGKTIEELCLQGVNAECCVERDAHDDLPQTARVFSAGIVGMAK